MTILSPVSKFHLVFSIVDHSRLVYFHDIVREICIINWRLTLLHKRGEISVLVTLSFLNWTDTKVALDSSPSPFLTWKKMRIYLKVQSHCTRFLLKFFFLSCRWKVLILCVSVHLSIPTGISVITNVRRYSLNLYHKPNESKVWTHGSIKDARKFNLVLREGPLSLRVLIIEVQSFFILFYFNFWFSFG